LLDNIVESPLIEAGFFIPAREFCQGEESIEGRL
jgi:hypothetical protein